MLKTIRVTRTGLPTRPGSVLRTGLSRTGHSVARFLACLLLAGLIGALASRALEAAPQPPSPESTAAAEAETPEAPKTAETNTPAPPAAAEAKAALTFTRDIAPLLQAHCQDCHRAGEIAPMALLDYEDTRPWIASIKDNVESGAMPPWHADPAHGDFANDPRLTKAEIETFVRWIDAGAPEGDPKDLPKPREFTEGWRLGEPDVVLSMPQEFDVPASGVVPYKYFTIPTEFEEDRWIRAIEVRPGNREVVHHIIAFVRERGKRLGLWEAHLGGTAPGEAPDEFPEGTGKLLPAGASIVLQMHYTPNGKSTTDRSSVGLHFSEKPLRQVHTGAAMNTHFKIPPEDDNYRVVSGRSFGQDGYLLSLMPHMHLRGKSFRFELERADGSRETLLDVPRYDFNWQHGYVFSEPLRIHMNDRIVCTAHFDNSAGNRANPNPRKTVRWGDQTWQEMMIGFHWFVEGDEKPAAPPRKRARGTEAEAR